MPTRTDVHSPKQVAQALGVSESSLKRWCDSGLIETSRTAGGHRKIVTAEVIRFARERRMNLASPELLGLPTSLSSTTLTSSVSLLTDSLLAGNASLSRQIVLNNVLTQPSIAAVFDDLIAQAFVQIGDRWACHQADVYQERRSCEIILRTLSELRTMQTAATGTLSSARPDGPALSAIRPDGLTLSACGGTAAGNPYSLQTLMAELVLHECGFRATSLGVGIPFESLARAIRQLQPTLFWLSAAYVADDTTFLNGFTQITTACAETQAVLVIGGRALTPALRQKLADATYCDTMQQLAGFAQSLARVHRRSSSRGRSPKPQKRSR